MLGFEKQGHVNCAWIKSAVFLSGHCHKKKRCEFSHNIKTCSYHGDKCPDMGVKCDLMHLSSSMLHLTQLRVGSHFLGIETGRFKTLITPVEQRTCQYCNLGFHSQYSVPPPPRPIFSQSVSLTQYVVISVCPSVCLSVCLFQLAY